MRVSTNQYQQTSTASILDQQARLSKTQQQLSTGRRILTPADDPAGAARALDMDKAVQALEQYNENIGRAEHRIKFEESVLEQVTNTLQRLRELTVQANNGTQGTSNRQMIGEEVRELHEHLIQLANTQDGTGEYLFAGTHSKTIPYPYDSETGTVEYAGGPMRFVQVGPGRSSPTTHPGEEVFGQGGDNLFNLVGRLADALEDPESVDDIHAELGSALNGLDRYTDDLLAARAQNGARLNALDQELNANEVAALELETALSATRDLDYNKAISDFNLQLVGLQAAQQTYMKIQGLSLFNYLR